MKFIPFIEFMHIINNYNYDYDCNQLAHYKFNDCDYCNIYINDIIAQKEINKKFKNNIIDYSIFVVNSDNITTDYFHKWIANLLKQKYKNFHIFIPQNLYNYRLEHSKIRVYRHIDQIQAKSNFFMFTSVGDVLGPYALSTFSKYITDNPHVNILYSDNDFIDDNNFITEYELKSEFNLEYFLCYDYIHKPVVFHNSLFSSELIHNFFIKHKNSIQGITYYLLLNYHNKTMLHIPHILCHVHEKNKLNKLTRLRIINEFKQSDKEFIYDVVDFPGENNVLKIKRKIEKEHLVSIIIPTKNQFPLIKNCIGGVLERNYYKNYEIIIVDNQSTDKYVINFYNNLTNKFNDKIKIISYNRKFNFSSMCNLGIEYARGDIILLLNNDTIPINKEWMIEMVSFAELDGVGCVGALLLYDDLVTVQHAGIVAKLGFREQYFLHEGHTSNINHCHYRHRLLCTKEVIMNTGAVLMFKKSLVDKIGFFDENFSNDFNDCDYCLRACQNKLKNIFTPNSKLVHHESQTRAKESDIKTQADVTPEIILKWGNVLPKSKFYSTY